MSRLTTETALDAYEAARHRLPPPGRQGAALRARSLEDIAARFDVFLLDGFGVLNIGETAIPGVRARMDGLRARGKRLVVLTNAASLPNDGLVAKYRALGFDFAPEELVSSRQALTRALAAEPARHWGVIAADWAPLDDLGGVRLTRLGEDAAAHAAVDGVIFLGSQDWTEARQRRLVDALRARPRPVWVGNPDIVAPREEGFSFEPGFFAHRLADETGVTPRFFGKPFPDVYGLALARLGGAVAPDRIVMVGDTLHTDVLGAQAAGIGSALIEGFGFFAGHSTAEAMARTGIRPDFVLERP